ncbi:MAG: amino acid adenylation domain-containing protein, partial [Acidobacteria bacterium]|nr:amino acid adenylation domain-containing protein [Acidobacteriota bacterium]
MMGEILQEKKARLRSLLKQPGESTPVPRVEARRQRASLEPLSFAQQGLWFVSKLEGPNPAYNIPVIVRWFGTLDVEALNRALTAVVGRHDSLRTHFVERGGVPSQAVSAVSTMRLEPQQVTRGEAEAVYRSEAQRPFDIAAESLFRAKLFSESKDRFVLVVTMHHSVADAWSVGVLLRELVALYEAYSLGEELSLEPLPITYADYVHWEREWLGGGVEERQISFWRNQLSELPPLLTLATDRPRPALQSNNGGTVRFASPPGLLERLKALSLEERCSLFVTLVAALDVLLARYSSQRDLAVGTGVANRRRPELEDLVGFFVNTLVIRARVAPEASFASILKATRETVLQAIAHQDAPYHRVVEELRPERSLSNSPFFQVMFTLQNAPYARRIELPEVVVEVEIAESGAAKFDLSIAIQEETDGLQGQIEYRSDIFDGDTVRRFAAHYLRLLGEVVAHPRRRLSEIDLRQPAERHQLLLEWNDSAVAYPQGDCLHELIEAQAERTPHQTAVVCAGESLTFQELCAAADRLAQRLQGVGVGSESIVGVLAERSLEMVVGLLAVLKAGGAYLPLDPDYPTERLAFMLTDSQAAVVLAQERLRRALPEHTPPILPLDSAAAVLGQPAAWLCAGARSESLAYVIYTSGSTGRPKGTMNSHRGIVNRLLWMQQRFGLSPEDRVLQKTPYSFDVSVWELFWPLLTGARLVMALPGGHQDPSYLARTIPAEGITTIHFVPSMLEAFLEASGLEACAASLVRVVASGEALPLALTRRFFARLPGVELHNLYGPTEAAVDVTSWTCDPEQDRSAIPIGRPVSNTAIHVVDSELGAVPMGVGGELLIGGVQVGRGYLSRPDLTAEMFVPDPFSGEPGARLYRTGDLGRLLASGELEYLSRIDHQVKVRGFRIELGEIESQLRAQEPVREAVVLAREDRPGDKRLVAYVVVQEGRVLDTASLREQVASKLPEHMVPSVFVVLEGLPLTPSGKVDRRALPVPEVKERTAGYVAARTELERQLCEIWAEVLGVERVGIEDSFFDLGGHSLLATQVLSRVRSALGVELPLKAVFEHRTVAALSERLPELSGGLVLPAIDVLAERSGLPLSYAQQRLWFIDRLEGGSSHYNIPDAVRVTGELDERALAAAFETIVERHESLRTVFEETNGEVCLAVPESVDFRLETRDLRGLEAEAREREVRSLALADARRPFDLSRDLLLRASLLKLAEEEHVLLLNMHHIASDGWSLGVLLSELRTLYEAYVSGSENPLSPLRVQYADFARWQRQWLRGEVLEGQLSYWRRQLTGLSLVHGLPLDKPRPAQQGFEGDRHVQRLDRERRNRLEAWCRQSGVTLFMLLETAFSVLLNRYSQETDIVVGLPIAGRVHRDLEPLIGFFVNTLVLRSDLSGNPRLVELLESSKWTILDAYAHQHAPFEMLVEELNPERSLRHNPLFQILFVLQNAARGDLRLGGSRLDWVGESSGIVKFDLELHGLEAEEGLVLNWLYKKELFDLRTIERLASSFGVLLEAILEWPEERVGDLSLLSPAQRRELLSEWRNRPALYPRERSIDELFEAQAERSPEAVALVLEGERLTYRELNEQANRLAHSLICQGVVSETLVGISMERSLEMLVGILGILKAGGAYVPLDPEYPEARLASMVEDSGVAVVLTQSRLAERSCFAGASTVALDDPEVQARLAESSADNPVRDDRRSNALAYVIYTSGSTGRPKGVMVEHRSVVRLVIQPDFLPLNEKTVMLQASSVSFDAATLEIWGPLLNGGRLVLYPERVPEVGRLNAQLERHGVNTLWLTAGLFEPWSHELPRSNELKWVLSGGDVVDPLAVVRVQEGLAGVEVINGYGPTENTTFTSCYPVPREFDSHRALPLGRPILGTGVYLLQEGSVLAALGAIGEICAVGDGLARGYLNRPELTAERFVEDPYSEVAGARLYRTGDLGRWRVDGSLEFLGRLDDQVKVRGFRVELGEIEAHLASQAQVREAVAVVREDRPGEKRLVAYVAAAENVDRESLAADLRIALQKILPDYIVPSAILVLESLPLTANGKVDRGALPVPAEGHYGRGEYVAPRTEMERLLCAIWEEVLGVERVGIEDSFFELGGHSLLATRVVSRVRSALGRELSLRLLFEHSTVGALCERLPELSGGWVLPPIEVLAERESFSLSYAQQRLWFIDRLEGGSSQYNIAGAGRMRGDLDKAAFACALETIVDRHESLRTVFREVDGKVRQVVRGAADFRLTEMDLSPLGPEARESEVLRLALADARRSFDLSYDPMLRVGLLKLSEKEQVVLFNMHHIASDGWSTGVLIRELEALYEAYRAGEENPLSPLRAQYADYAQWQRQWLQGEVLEEQLSYWRSQLEGLPRVHNLPLDAPRPARQGFEGGRHVQWLGSELRDRAAARCRESGVTLFMLLEAAFAVLLSRYSQETDIVVGSPIAGRVHRDLEPLIGFFVNTLVLRSDLSGNLPFVELLRSSQQTILDAYAHQHAPFEMLVEELKPERSLSHSPLFQILFVLQNREMGDVARLGGSALEWVGEGSGIVKFDLELNVLEREGGLVLHWWYKRDLFSGDTIERMASNFAVLLAGLLERPEERVQSLPLLTAMDRRQLLEWNETRAAYPQTACLHELIEAQAERTPDQTAVVYGEESLTYRELCRAADRLAQRLRGAGVGVDGVVGVLAERSLEMVVGLLAVLKAGGAYLPLDPDYPAERLAFMLADSKTPVVLAQERLLPRLPEHAARVLPLDGVAQGGGGEAPWQASGARPESLAYVIYTSGSTGRPKGTMNSHRGIVNRLVWMQQRYGLNSADRVLQKTPYSFDVSVWELFWPLLSGARLVMALPGGHQDPSYLARTIQSEGITTTHFVPSMLEAFLEAPGLEACAASLVRVMASGEALPLELTRRFFARLPGVELHNLYGPTEAAVDVTSRACDAEDRRVPIGRPVANTAMHVVDGELGTVPVGVGGELLIGGVQVGRGYLSRPDLTAEKFIPDPFSDEPGARLYRTGDLGRWLSSGELEYLGRIDHQVKLRGFRIELGEIESQLRSLGLVREAVVLAREDRPGDKRLVAYVVGREGLALDTARLRERLASKLPEYMVPSAFVVLDWLPLTASGKVDRRALPAPEMGERGEYVAPRTEIERWLCEIWEELLGVERVGIEDNFFDLGGHSLLATQVVSRVRSALGVEVPLRTIFECPTIEGLSARLPEVNEGLVLPAIEALARRERFALSFAQQRLWFIDRLEGDSTQYNIPVAVRVKGDLDAEAFARSLSTLVERHESLRTVFQEIDGEVFQVIREDAGFRLAARDLSGLELDEREREVRRLALEDARKPFDLSRDLLLRVSLLTLATDEHVVLLCMHHIASDGWSMVVLVKELGKLYKAYRAGEKNPLPPLRVQYADYAQWQRQWLQGEVLEAQLSYWRRQLAGLPQVHGLPLDRPRPARQGFEGGEHIQRLGRELRDRAEVRCRESGVTLFMFLQAAFSVLLSRYSHEQDIVVGSPIAGRVHRDVEPLIGFLVNTLVLRSDLSGNPRFLDFLETSRQTILDSYAHQHVPFEMLVEELKPERSLRHSPLFQILIVLQNTEQNNVELGGSRLEAVGGSVGVVRFDLELNVMEFEDGLVLSWWYKKELFHPETIERLASSFGVLLDGILEHPEERVEELPLLAEADRRRLLTEWRERPAQYPRERSIEELFEAQVERSPEAVAVELEEERLTYRELNERANRLAHSLLAQGVVSETLVGLCLERSLEMLVGILGILKAGGAYVPLDPEYPEARLAAMLEDSGVALVLTQSRLAERSCFAGGRTVALDDPEVQARLAESSAANPGREDRRSSALAYVIYTSGSTGQPKGVMVEHRSVVRLVIQPDFLPLTEQTVMLQASSVSFDAATLEIWGPLLNGGRLVLYPERVPEVGRLNTQLERHGVNTLWLTAGLFEQWSYQLPRASALQWVLSGGDVVDPQAVVRVQEGLAGVEV